MKTGARHRTIRLKRLLSVIQTIILLVTVIFFLLWELHLIQTIRNDSLFNARLTVDKIASQFNNERSRIRDMLYYMQTDEHLGALLADPLAGRQQFDAYARPFLLSSDAINSICLILTDGRFFSTENNRLSQQTISSLEIPPDQTIQEYYRPFSAEMDLTAIDSLTSGIYYAATYQSGGSITGILLIDINQLLLCADSTIGRQLMICQPDDFILLEGQAFRQDIYRKAVFHTGGDGLRYARQGFYDLLAADLPDTPLTLFWLETFPTLNGYTYQLAMLAGIVVIIYLLFNYLARRIIDRHLLNPILETGRRMEQAYIIGMTETMQLTGKSKNQHRQPIVGNIFWILILSIIAPFLMILILIYSWNIGMIRDISISGAESCQYYLTETLHDDLSESVRLERALATEINELCQAGWSGETSPSLISGLLRRYRLAGADILGLTIQSQAGEILYAEGKGGYGRSSNLQPGRYPELTADEDIITFWPLAGSDSSGPGELLICSEHREINCFRASVAQIGGKVRLIDAEQAAWEKENDTESIPAAELIQAAAGKPAVFKWQSGDRTGAVIRLFEGRYLLAAVTAYGQIRQNARAVNGYLLFCSISVLLLIFGCAIILAKRLAEMVRQVSQYFDKINVLDQTTMKSDQFFLTELDTMEKAFNGMVEKNRTLIDELISSNNEKNLVAIEKKDSEIRALQAQINPHFLHNTLNSIVALIDTDQKDEAKKVIRLIGTLFRCGISRKDVSIPIREEIEYLDAYLNIMTLRFGKRFRYQINVSETIYQYKTIKLILQPIVENSLMHGYSEKFRNFNVTISAREEEKRIVFEIADNGVGMSENQLYILRRQLDEEGSGNRIGLINVQTRLRLYFGPAYGLEIESTQNVGTLVRLNLKKYN